MNIKGNVIGHVNLQLQVKRKDTGKIDTYDLKGTVMQPEEPKKDVGNDLNRSA